MHKVSYQEKARTQVSASQQDSQRLYKDHQVTGNSPEDMQAWSDFPKFQCFPFFVTLKVKLVRIKKKKERERERALHQLHPRVGESQQPTASSACALSHLCTE